MELVLPILSVVLIAFAFGIALIAWLRSIDHVGSTRVTSWDISGALCFLGCGAAIFGEAEAILPLMMEEFELRK